MSTEYIICYDISCPRRLGRVHRWLQKQAMPLQYSVFYFHGTPHQLDHCLSRLQKLIDPRHDDLRAYPLPQRGLRISLGQAVLPEGIHLGYLPPEWQNQPQSEPAERLHSFTITGGVTDAWLLT